MSILLFASLARADDEIPRTELASLLGEYQRTSSGVVVGGDWNTIRAVRLAARPLGLKVVRSVGYQGAEIEAALARTGASCGVLIRVHDATRFAVDVFGACGAPPPPPEPAPAPASQASAPAIAAAPTDTRPVRTVAFVRLLVLDDELLVGDAAETYRLFLVEEARKQGLSVPVTSVLFERVSDQAADLQIGAILSVACTSPLHSCELTADWEVLDPGTHTVVYATKTRNEAASRLAMVEAASSELQHTLLSGALARLVARPGFQETIHVQERSDGPPTWTAPLPVARCPIRAVAAPDPLAEALQATVVVEAGPKIGSGVSISPDGYVLTAAHVVEGSTDVGVRLRSGLSLGAKVIRVDAAQDMAVLDVAGSGHACAPIVTVDLPIAAPLLAVGAPLGPELAPGVTRGIVSSYRSVEGRRLLQTDAAISPGNSGGPLLSENGEVAAIVSFKLVGSAVEGIGFGVPAADVLRRLDIVLGDVSAPDPTALVGRRGGSAPKTRTDPEDRSMFASGIARPTSTVRYWSTAEKAGVGTMLGLSAAFAASAAASYAAGPSADTLDGWNTASAVNGVSWGLSGAALTVGLGWALGAISTEVTP